jgi:hypothetical protein
MPGIPACQWFGADCLWRIGIEFVIDSYFYAGTEFVGEWRGCRS